MTVKNKNLRGLKTYLQLTMNGTENSFRNSVKPGMTDVFFFTEMTRVIQLALPRSISRLSQAFPAEWAS